jgi:hypothetical protein
MTRDKPNGELTRPVEILLRLSSKQSGVIYPAVLGRCHASVLLLCVVSGRARHGIGTTGSASVPYANPHRIGPVAWAIVCLAEQNIMMIGLGFPLRRSQELREVARTLVDSIR